MSIRVLFCFLFVLGFSIYAWRNWFVSLCASIFLVAFIQHPDMPRNIADIQGLNPWNFLILNVFLAWLFHRQRDGLVWDMPGSLAFLMALFVCMILLAAIRLLLGDPSAYGLESGYIVSEKIINCVKWLLPALMLFDGCRNRTRIHLATATILTVYFLLAVQVIRWVPLEAATADGADMNRIGARFIQNEIGFNRVTLSMMLGGASWAVLCCLGLVRGWKYKVGIVGVAMAIMLGQALTGGRTGYVTWILVGLLLSLLRWPKYLLLVPVVMTMVMVLLPGVRNRFTQGFADTDGRVVVRSDDYEITSGRTLAWPLVLDKIGENPLWGYGREGMTTTGTADYLLQQLNESFPHPHNAYLEVMLDNGMLGLFLVLPLFGLFLIRSLQLLRDRDEILYTAVGGIAFSLVMALLLGSMGGQTFYPREGSVGMWASVAVMFRLYLERQRTFMTGEALFGEKVMEESGDDYFDLSDDSAEAV